MSSAIENFEILVRHGALRGVFQIDDFLDAFKAMEPSLHRYCREAGVVDVDALVYTTARLPDGVHALREFLVQADVPDKLPQMAGIRKVETPARRRSTFLIGEDVVIVVAREGVTELLDLVTLLTSYAIEAHKIAHLLRDTPLLKDLRAYLAGPPDLVRQNRLMARLAFQLGSTDDALVRLDASWGGELLPRMLYLVDNPATLVVRLHRDYSIEASRQRARAWSEHLFEQTAVLSQKEVHIVSSNLFAAVNLLSGFPRLHTEAIWDWASTQSSHRELFQNAAGSESARTNLIYMVLPEWLQAFPDRLAERLAYDREHGLQNLEDTFHVGVGAQAIALAKLDFDRLDPRLTLDRAGILERSPLLLNFDYAFGEQAGIVVEQLFRRFAGRVASFSIMGKAGTVVGDRGGVMLPNYLLREGSRDVYDLPFGNYLDPADFRELELGAVYSDGPMLTVLGTILQNDAMLLSYRDEWKILGLEMEGIPYLRALHQCRKLGFLRDDLRVGVAYWASDAPLRVGEGLSHESALQGLTAVYAINVAILNCLLGTGVR